jgi:low affinity Fe/Cu permease
MLQPATLMSNQESSLAQAKKNYFESRKGQRPSLRELFHRFAHTTAAAVGTPPAFLAAVLVIVIWAITGPIFRFSDTWQLVINTGTTIVTFLMVFLIQNTQNRDAKAIHLKLDELIRAKHGARNTLVDLEECTEEELARIEEEFRRLRERAEHKPDSRKTDVEPANR